MMDNDYEMICEAKTGEYKGFFGKVYEIVAQIPEGKVATYGQIALMLEHPKGARLVGWAMNSMPYHMKLPCHRVVNKSGSMSPGLIFGGADKQRAMLEQEGVTFKENGCINMEKHVWQAFKE